MRGWHWMVWMALAFASGAQGAIYEHALRVDDDDDGDDETEVVAMQEREELSADVAENLVDLLRQGVDLGSASRTELEELPGLDSDTVERIVEYRSAQGRLDAPADLLAAGLVDRAQLRALTPFLRSSRSAEGTPVSGDLRLLTRVMSTDTLAPPVILGSHLSGPFGLSGGAWLATTRQSPSPAKWDPSIEGLITRGFEYQARLPSAALEWQWGRARVVAGTFALGFGERLVLDNTRRTSPDGVMLGDGFHRQGASSSACRLSPPPRGPCSEQGSATVTSDFSFRELFRGVAGSLKDLPLSASAKLSLHGFVSYQTRSLLQYEVYDRRTCADPHDDAGSTCRAPPVYLSDLSTRVLSTTLPALFDELALGGHLSFELAERWTLGATGYGAWPSFNAKPADLDFQEWSRWPGGGAFGAVGLNGAFRAGAVGLFIEAARTFDGSTGNEGGGFGVEQRSVWAAHGHQLELAVRYFDLHFLNPYARPISAPGEYDGQRARNEAGVRLRHAGRLGPDWRLSGRVDFWLNPFEEPGRQPALVTNLQALARVDLNRWSVAAPSLWLEANRRNLGAPERRICATIEYTQGDPFSCSGDRYRATARLELIPLAHRVRLATQGSLSWVRDASGLRNDVVAWAELDWRILEPVRLRARARYLSQDPSNHERLEKSVLGLVEVAWSPTRMVRLVLRYEVYGLLDSRRSTLTRWPNPEHRFALDARLTL